MIETYRSRYTKLAFMNRSTRCTEIYVDFKDEKIYIVNYTEDILYRTFGCDENPTWLDFLESRCFPKTRDKMKWILRELEFPCYDPLLIIEKKRGVWHRTSIHKGHSLAVYPVRIKEKIISLHSYGVLAFVIKEAKIVCFVLLPL